MRGKQLVIALVTIAGFALAALPTSPAAGSPPDPGNSGGGSPGNSGDASAWGMYVAHQHAVEHSLGPLTREIDQLTGSTPSGWAPGMNRPSKGYASQVMVGTDALDLYWKGPLTPAVQQAIAHHPDVKVTVHQAAWDEDEIMTAQNLIVDKITGVLPEGVGLGLAMHETDMSAIIISLDGVLTDTQLTTLRRQVATWTSIPVTIRNGGGGGDPVVGRQSDGTPYRGGATLLFTGAGLRTAPPTSAHRDFPLRLVRPCSS